MGPRWVPDTNGRLTVDRNMTSTLYFNPHWTGETTRRCREHAHIHFWILSRILLLGLTGTYDNSDCRPVVQPTRLPVRRMCTKSTGVYLHPTPLHPSVCPV
jgi:hypothetical protein